MKYVIPLMLCVAVSGCGPTAQQIASEQAFNEKLAKQHQDYLACDYHTNFPCMLRRVLADPSTPDLKRQDDEKILAAEERSETGRKDVKNKEAQWAIDHPGSPYPRVSSPIILGKDGNVWVPPLGASLEEERTSRTQFEHNEGIRDRMDQMQNQIDELEITQ